jgi:hypothetical protein
VFISRAASFDHLVGGGKGADIASTPSAWRAPGPRSSADSLERGLTVFAKHRGLLTHSSTPLALQLALNGVEGDLKWEHDKRRPADDGGAEGTGRALFELSNDGVALPANRDAAVAVNILPEVWQAGSVLPFMRRRSSGPATTRQRDSNGAADQNGCHKHKMELTRGIAVRLLLLRSFTASHFSEHCKGTRLAASSPTFGIGSRTRTLAGDVA